MADENKSYSHYFIVITFILIIIILIIWNENILHISYHNHLSVPIESENISQEVIFGSINSSIPSMITKYDIAYYQQWNGSWITSRRFRNAYHNICNLPTILFIWNHKTGGYMKHWKEVFKTECDLYPAILPKHFYDIYSCHISHNGTIKQNQNELKQCYLNDQKTFHIIQRQLMMQSQPIKLETEVNNNRLRIFDPYEAYIGKSELIQIKERSVNDLIMVQKELNKYKRKQDYIAIMMVREPIKTILSGYNYHARGHEKDWINASLFQYGIQPRRGAVPLIYCFKNIWNTTESVINISSTMYLEYKKGYIDNYADNDALQYGLYLEFTRFVNCEWPLHWNMYTEIKDNKKYKEKHLFLRFQWFHEYNYSKSVVYFLYQLGISKEIYSHKTHLLHDLLSMDLDSPTHNGSTIGESSEHVTRGKYNETLQIKLLLEYSNAVCICIKRMSFLLQFEWKYKQYC